MANTPATYNTHESTFQPNQIIQNRLLDTARYKINTENLSDLLALVKRKKKLVSLKIVTKFLFSVCLLLNEEFKQLLQKLFSTKIFFYYRHELKTKFLSIFFNFKNFLVMSYMTIFNESIKNDL